MYCEVHQAKLWASGVFSVIYHSPVKQYRYQISKPRKVIVCSVSGGGSNPVRPILQGGEKIFSLSQPQQGMQETISRGAGASHRRVPSQEDQKHIGKGSWIASDRIGALHPIPGQTLPHPTSIDRLPWITTQVRNTYSGKTTIFEILPTSLEVGESCHGVVIGFKRDPALGVGDNLSRQPRDMITQGGMITCFTSYWPWFFFSSNACNVLRGSLVQLHIYTYVHIPVAQPQQDLLQNISWEKIFFFV